MEKHVEFTCIGCDAHNDIRGVELAVATLFGMLKCDTCGRANIIETNQIVDVAD
jgi:hypothetical protein